MAAPGSLSGCLGDFANKHGAPPLPRSRRLLVHVDLVAVQVLERHAGAVRLNLWLAVELDASVLHPAIFAQAVIRLDPEEGLRATLLADQGSVLVGRSQIQGDGHHGNPTMIARGNGVGGVVVSSLYGSPKLKISSTQPSGVMSCRSWVG